MLRGEYETARKHMFRLLELHSLMYVDGSPSGIKQVLELLNICKNYVRLPLVPVSEKLKNQIAEKLKYAEPYLQV